MYLTVDLASRMSAVILRDVAGQVIRQFDSRDKSPREFVECIAKLVHNWNPQHILVEDVPFGISSQFQTKPVTRLQGMLMYAMDRDFYFVSPSQWQNSYPGVARAPKGMTKNAADKYRIEQARKHAEDLGYSPPDLVAQWQIEHPDLKPLKRYTAPLEKSMTDYVSAYLMSDWLMKNVDTYTTLSGVQISNI